MQPYNIDEIINRAKNAEGNPSMEQKIKNEAVGALTAEQKRRLENALENPDELKRLLSSPAAQSIMKKLGK